MQRSGDSPYSLARKLGDVRKQPTLHRFLEGVAKEPKRSTLQPVADFYQVPLDAFYDPTIADTVARFALIDGPQDSPKRNPELIRQIIRDNPQLGYAGKPTPAEFTIPQYEAGGSMGRGLVLEELPPGLIKSWRVDHDWLRLNVRTHTGVGNLCIVTGFGPSMRGMYNPGDPLLVDRGVTSVDSDGVFFFRVGDHGFIKMLQRIPTAGGLIIRAKSKNPDYDPFDITAEMDFQVFGKVLTVWKSEQL